MIAAANDRLYEKLRAALKLPDEERFRTNAQRVQHREELVARISAVTRTMTRDTLRARLETAGVPCAPILDMLQVLDEPQTAATGMLRGLIGGQAVAWQRFPRTPVTPT